MKKATLILAMLLTAATAFSQTSRRTANDTKTANDEKKQKTTTVVKRSTDDQKQATSRTGQSSQRTTTTTRRTVSSSEINNNRSASNPSRNSSTNVTTSRRISSSGTNSNGNTRPSGTSTTTTRRTTVTTPAQTNNHSYSSGSAVHNNQHRVATGDINNHHRGNKGGTTYVTYYESPRLFRSERVVSHHYHTPPRSVHYRARHYPYRSPVHIDIIWTPAMRTEYIEIYPMVTTWRYPVGYRIESVSAYNAMYYRGEVMNVYGKVEEVFYSRETDEFILYFGAYYPYHDFSVVIPGPIARKFSMMPERRFEQQYVSVTGLITTFEGKPEIAVRRASQLSIY